MPARHDTKLYKKVYVKKSRLPNAGKGLFAKTKIAPDEVICPYEGDILTNAELYLRYPSFDSIGNDYVLALDKGRSIDAFPYKWALGRFANDANLRGKSRYRNNAEFHTSTIGHYTGPALVALRRIEKDTEILVDYGYHEEIEDDDSESLGTESLKSDESGDDE